MTDYEKLRAQIAEEMFGKEPLALALINVLASHGIVDSREVVARYDERVSCMLDSLIKKYNENDEAATVE